MRSEGLVRKAGPFLLSLVSWVGLTGPAVAACIEMVAPGGMITEARLSGAAETV